MTEFGAGCVFLARVRTALTREHRRGRSSCLADKLSKAGWSWRCVATVDAHGRTIFVEDAHRDDGKRFVVRVDGKLTAFVELERITRESLRSQNAE
jgi:hypothetical protein